MAIRISSIEILQQYLTGVLNRAEHHAGNVESVALALLGAVVWRSDGEIEVREYNGQPANILWFEIDNNRYALIYNHQSGRIEMRDRTQRGTVLHEFDNATSTKSVLDIFRNL